MAIADKGMRGFLVWAKKRVDPRVYAAFASKFQSGLPKLSGLGDDASDLPLVSAADPAATASAAPATSTWSDTVSNLFKGLSTIYLTKTQLDAQSKIIDTNLARAKQGLAPLDVSAYSLNPTVGVGLSSSTQTLLMYGGLAFLGVWLVTSMSKRRKQS